MSLHRCNPRTKSDNGVALVIVLAFVVLLAGIVVAYLARTTTYRQLAHGTFNEAKADQLARSALDIILGDLKQEIVDGSSPTSLGASTIQIPTSAANMIPRTSGTPSIAPPIPNLIRRSVQSDPIAPPGISSRASALNSAPSLSPSPGAVGKGEVSAARWNKHYLIPKENTGDDQTDPVSSFVVPDWVIVTNHGPKPFAAWDNALRDPVSDAFAIGRYAYAIYDEGGLLDINVAGYPFNTPPIQSGRKGSLAFADLTVIGLPNAPSDDPKQVDRVVGWRNYASAQPSVDTSASFPKFSFTGGASGSVSRYLNFVLSNTNGFLQTSGLAWNGPSGMDSARTDQAFLSRQELIAYRRATQFSANALQYLGTFSRERDVPTWSPAIPSITNPDLRTTPVVQRRFPLSRLVWLTYKGPSALRPLTDPDLALITGAYGIPSSYLMQGTSANIQKSFGLIWNDSLERWDYAGPSGTTPASAIANLSNINGREPNFFELLQAGILDDSLGDSIASAFPITHQQSKTLQVLAIGANLISQVTVDSYPTRIAGTVGTATMEGIGTERLPYLNMLATCAVGCGLPSKTGGVSWFLIPNIWDPFRNTSDLTALPLRPEVQITAMGNASFASVSGGSVNPISTMVTTGSAGQSHALLSSSATGGRDGLSGGFPEAAKLDSGDLPAAAVMPTPAQFNAYPFGSESSNGTATSIGWRLTNALSGANRYAVLRLSHPGTAILAANLGQNPVLILSPGFQVSLDYQSPSGIWRSYSFLQGNNDSGTRMNSVQLIQNGGVYSIVTGLGPAAGSRTITSAADPSLIAPWTMSTLTAALTFIKSDPRSIRFNSVLDRLSSSETAAVVNSVWPSGSSPPNLSSGNANPALYSQNINGAALFYRDGGATGPVRMGDNGPSVSNAYGTGQDPYRPVVLNRPLRSVAEMGYAFRDQPFKTLDFSTANSADAGLLDLFCVNENSNTSGLRAAAINLNTKQAPVLAAVIHHAVQADDITPTYVGLGNATTIATNIVSNTLGTPFINRAELIGALATDTTLPLIKTQHEAVLRALAEVGQTRTWNLMIDVIAQPGRYPPTASSLADFVVEGEKRYWLHVAIDRFTGEIIDQQLEAVYE
jgi:hypothetical protein